MCVSDAPVPAGQPESRAAQRRPDTRLSRTQRVLDPGIFRDAFDRGPHYAGRFMVMWLARGAEGALRLGVVASKRSFHEAVQRSKAKRLLRESYRLNRFRLSGKQDVILVARRPILNAARQDVERDLMALAERAGMVERAQ